MTHPDVTIYGIPNCGTMKKARLWLEEHGIAYRFHDYTKLGIDPGVLARWVEACGWEKLLNRAGTTFRRIPEADRSGLDTERAVALMGAFPSAIKRPVLAGPFGLEVGFRPERYEALFSASSPAG